MKKVLLIHGANSSPRSFNYLKAKLPESDFISLPYDVLNGFYFNLERMIETIGKDEEYELISHSMGGLFGVHLTQHCKIKKGVSIATPFAGSAFADWCRYMMPYYPLFQDVHTRSLPIQQAAEIQLNIPWLQIVTTRGNVPWLRLPNDSVVTVPSMTSRNDMQYCYLEETHHEVMLSDDAAKEIGQFLFG
jgi:esterase/lipase